MLAQSLCDQSFSSYIIGFNMPKSGHATNTSVVTGLKDEPSSRLDELFSGGGNRCLIIQDFGSGESKKMDYGN